MSSSRLTVGARLTTSASLVSYAEDHPLSMCRPVRPRASGPPPTRWNSIRRACSEPDLQALHGWNEAKCCVILCKRDRSHCGILRHGIGLLQLPGAETRPQAGSMSLKLGWTRQNLGRQTGGRT